MIQGAILVLLIIVLLVQIGMLRLDRVMDLFVKEGYESDDDGFLPVPIVKRKHKHTHVRSHKPTADDSSDDDDMTMKHKHHFTQKDDSHRDETVYAHIQSREQSFEPVAAKGSGDPDMTPISNLVTRPEDEAEQIQLAIMKELNDPSTTALTPAPI